MLWCSPRTQQLHAFTQDKHQRRASVLVQMVLLRADSCWLQQEVIRASQTHQIWKRNVLRREHGIERVIDCNKNTQRKIKTWKVEEGGSKGWIIELRGNNKIYSYLFLHIREKQIISFRTHEDTYYCNRPRKCSFQQHLPVLPIEATCFDLTSPKS